jgi:hypothetical protein
MDRTTPHLIALKKFNLTQDQLRGAEESHERINESGGTLLARYRAR